jgi:hypothetical protein
MPQPISLPHKDNKNLIMPAPVCAAHGHILTLTTALPAAG